MARAGVTPGTGPLAEFFPSEELQHHADFPVLNQQQRYDGNLIEQNARGYDPSRTRFATAVKKAPASSVRDQNYVSQDPMLVASNSEHDGTLPNSNSTKGLGLAVIAPRSSPRIPLRPPTLIPSIPTGASVNEMYMAYRQRALQLGAARNACLSRAADAWRRGDGAAAKRFSRDANGLNVKMRGEMRTAAAGLVRERGRVVRDTVANEPSGIAGKERGRECGNGLGVVLGVASVEATTRGGGGAGKSLTSEERMEVILDLHGLHSNEATEVLEEFLLAVRPLLPLSSLSD